jgi:hypothetical protein
VPGKPITIHYFKSKLSGADFAPNRQFRVPAMLLLCMVGN